MILRAPEPKSLEEVLEGVPYLQVVHLPTLSAGLEQIAHRPAKGRLTLVMMAALSTSDDAIPVSVSVVYKNRREVVGIWTIPGRAGFDDNPPFDFYEEPEGEPRRFLAATAPCKFGFKLLCNQTRRGTVTVITGGFNRGDVE